MSPRSLLYFFFPHTSSHAFRTPSLKVFHKSGASVLTRSFTLFSNLTLLRFSFNFQIFLMILCFLTTFFRAFLSRSTSTSLCRSSHAITFTSLIRGLFKKYPTFLYKAHNTTNFASFIQSPSKYSPWQYTHFFQRFCHLKHLLNSSSGMLPSSSVDFFIMSSLD